jgi:hypothetical protein
LYKTFGSFFYKTFLDTQFFAAAGFVLAGINLFLNYRALDSLYMFLIVWYYCTLTIRESILKVNGSRIKVTSIGSFFLPCSQ